MNYHPAARTIQRKIVFCTIQNIYFMLLSAIDHFYSVEKRILVALS